MSDKPSMTRQGYELIAGVIRDARSRAGCNALAPRSVKTKSAARLAALASIAEDFAIELRRTNSRFDCERFMRACDPAEQYTNRSRATRERNDSK